MSNSSPYFYTNMILIGSTMVDYLAVSDKKLIYRDSNIGTVRISTGGVMHNVACDLSYLGFHPLFVTALSEDKDGQNMRNEMEAIGIKIMSPESRFPSARYMAIDTPAKDLDIGVVDNRIFSSLDKNYLRSIASAFNEAEHIVIDANLDEDSISYLLKEYSAKRFYVEGVSAAKIIRFRRHLKGLFLFSCNSMEAQVLLNKKGIMPKTAVREIRNRGVLNAVVTDGEKGIYYATEGKDGFIPSDRLSNIVSTNGCGDALFAGTVGLLYMGKSLEEALVYGKRLADIVLESPEATSVYIKSLALF